MSVLVDSSVWIDYFRTGDPDELDTLLTEDLVVTNDIVLTELIPALQLIGQEEVVHGLQNIPLIPLQIDWNLIRRYQLINLQTGINKVGIPDLIILQQVIEHHLTLYTRDKHFGLMQGQFDFRIL